MKLARQQELLDRVASVATDQPWQVADHSVRNPASAYVEPARFAREMEVLFRGKPQFFGLTDECRKPGSFLAQNLGGVPVVVVRQQDGSLRAFVNICRHRGATLLQEGGGKVPLTRILCPYHGWTYDLGGHLVNRPASGGGFDDIASACKLDLHARAVSEKHGMIFVHPTSNEPFDADTELCGAQHELADFGLGDYLHFETRVNTWKMNWKLLWDTFTESYHLRWLHKDSIAPYFLNDMLFDAFGTHGRVVALRRDALKQFKEKPRSEWSLLPYSTTEYFLVPRGLIVYQIDHIEVWRVTPIDVGSCSVSTSMFAPPVSHRDAAHWKRNLDLLLDVTGTEDFPLQERIQLNLASGAMPEVIYGRIEPALIHLHRQVNEAVGASFR